MGLTSKCSPYPICLGRPDLCCPPAPPPQAPVFWLKLGWFLEQEGKEEELQTAPLPHPRGFQQVLPR